MAPPDELADELEVEFEVCAQSAAGKATIHMVRETISKTVSKENARKRRNWRMESSAEAMEPGSLLQDGNDKSFGLILLKIRCKLLSRRVMERAPILARRRASAGGCDLGHLV